MLQGTNDTFITMDRFGNPNEALNLNGGYTYVPPGVYFNSAFTISTWLYPNQVGSFARVLDFGTGVKSNVIFGQSYYLTMLPFTTIYDITQVQKYITLSNVHLTNNRWSFLATTFDGTTSNIYINGVLASTQAVSYILPENLVRQNNYIGRSNFAVNGYSYSILDDLRIYNRCLSDVEISALMNL